MDYFLFGNDRVIKVVQHMDDEQMGYPIGSHLLEWLMDGLDNCFPVFGIHHVEQ